MAEMSSNWEEELERWLKPFLDCLCVYRKRYPRSLSAVS
jgi:hypothetical protein